MGFLGSKRGLTPHLDDLAREGVVFSRAYAQVPLTPPSHACIFTGTYPQFNHLRYMGEALEPQLPYLPDLLHQRGYRTGAFVGSMILDPKNVTGHGFERGYDRYDAGFHQRGREEDRYQSVERRAGDVVERAVTWLKQRSAGPFFLWVHFYDAHGPYDPPEPYKTKYAGSPYDGEIAYSDAALGKLFGYLKERKLYEGAVIVVTADHGEAFGEHGEQHHGILLYDETIRVPLVIKLPKQVAAGTVVDSRVRSVDISPTILQVAKLSVPAAMQGQSMLSVIPDTADKGKVVDRPVFSESIYAHRAFGWSILRSWRTGKYLYVQAPERELYDQTADQKAEKNLAPTAKAVADTLSAQVDDFQSKTAAAGGSGKASLDPEQAESLRALGYLPSASAGPTTTEIGGIDPKSKIQIANLLTDALFDSQERRYEDAVPKLEQVLKDEPGTNLAYLELGKAFVRLKKYDQAVPLLREAVTRLPEDRSSHFELGRALSEMGNWPDAVPEFKAAAAQNPDSPEIHFYLALAYERAGRPQDAMSTYRKTIELRPNDFRANLLLGRQLGLNKRAKEALPYFEKAVKIRPESIDAHQFLSNAYESLGQKTAARRERETAQRLRAASGSRTEPSETHD